MPSRTRSTSASAPASALRRHQVVRGQDRGSPADVVVAELFVLYHADDDHEELNSRWADGLLPSGRGDAGTGSEARGGERDTAIGESAIRDRGEPTEHFGAAYLRMEIASDGHTECDRERDPVVLQYSTASGYEWITLFLPPSHGEHHEKSVAAPTTKKKKLATATAPGQARQVPRCRYRARLRTSRNRPRTHPKHMTKAASTAGRPAHIRGGELIGVCSPSHWAVCRRTGRRPRPVPECETAEGANFDVMRPLRTTPNCSRA